MKLATRIQLFAFVLLLNLPVFSQKTDAMSLNIPTVSLCTLLRNPPEYSGKTVKTTARIVRGRHVTGVWDPACRKMGADLRIELSAQSPPGILELEAALGKFESNDYPVVATLIGVWLPKETTDDAFLPQPRRVLLVSAASNIGRSIKVERR